MSLRDHFKSDTSLSRDVSDEAGENTLRKEFIVGYKQQDCMLRWGKILLKFCWEHVVCTEEQCRNYNFIEKSKFSLFDPMRTFMYGAEKKNESQSKCVRKTVKVGGSRVLAWGYHWVLDTGSVVACRLRETVFLNGCSKDSSIKSWESDVALLKWPSEAFYSKCHHRMWGPTEFSWWF